MITPAMLSDRRDRVGFELYAAIYSSQKDDEILVVPELRMDTGLYSEQKPSAKLPFKCSFDDLGLEVRKSLLQFDTAEWEIHRRERQNRSDWPAYKSSKAKSVRSFEERYLGISIQTVNANLKLEGPGIFSSEVYVGGWRSWSVSDEELGRLILNIHAAIRHLQESKWG